LAAPQDSLLDRKMYLIPYRKRQPAMRVDHGVVVLYLHHQIVQALVHLGHV
jgi:hypothetical protein